MSEVKFTKEELKGLQDLQQGYQQKQMQFGQVKVQRLLVQQQLDSIDNAEAQLEAEYGKVQEQEKTLVESLNKKYGPGQLDPATGVFTATSTPSDEKSL